MPSTYRPPYVGSAPTPESRLGKIGRRLFAASVFAALAVGGVFVYRAVQPPTWDPMLEPYVSFVEAERGLTFTHPVDLRWADIAQELEDDSDAFVTGIGVTDTPGADPWSEGYRLLGLIDPNPDVALEDEVAETLAENAGAFYEPWNETIVLPEGQSELSLGITIVHELTHALQHQNGMLGAGLDSADGTTARAALVEGDAERIAMAWYWSRTDAEREAYLEAIGYDPDDVPEDPGDSFLEASFYSSYGIGLPMAQTIVEADGQGALDRLLRAKNPGTTERMVDVLGASDRSSVDVMARMTLPTGVNESVGDLGARTWFQALAPIVGNKTAFDALTGYDDDAFAIYEADGTTCGRFVLSFDTAGDADEFVGVLDGLGLDAQMTLLGDTNSVQVNAVQTEICAPIGDPQDQRIATVIPLVLANELALYHLQEGVDRETARCASMGQAADYPDGQPSQDSGGWDAIVDVSAQYIGDCQ